MRCRDAERFAVGISSGKRLSPRTMLEVANALDRHYRHECKCDGTPIGYRAFRPVVISEA